MFQNMCVSTAAKHDAYAELHAHSAFTFLGGANLPAALVNHACNCGLEALAVLDADGMCSAVQVSTQGKTLDS